jgi:hypothetical protein
VDVLCAQAEAETEADPEPEVNSSDFNSSETINNKFVDFSDSVFKNNVFKTKYESLCTLDLNANGMCNNLCQDLNEKVSSNGSSRLNVNAVPFIPKHNNAKKNNFKNGLFQNKFNFANTCINSENCVTNLLNRDKILNVNATPFVTNEGLDSVVDLNLFNNTKTSQDFDGFLPSPDKGDDLGHVDTSLFTSHTLCNASLTCLSNTCTIDSSNGQK